MDKLAARVLARYLAMHRVAAKYKDKKKTDAGNTVYMYSEMTKRRRTTTSSRGTAARSPPRR
jgi:hypothetical protein